MTFNDILWLAAGIIGSLCFGILFNMRGKKLAAAALGGILTSGLYILLSRYIQNEPINYFIVAAAVSLYAEIMARLLKTPASPVVTTSLIPLIPGGSLYYTMAYAFRSDYDLFIEKAAYTIKLASALALGIITVTALSHFLFRKNPHSHKA